MNDEELILKYVPLNKQNKALKKLNKGYPVQYLIGNVDFAGYIINVNKDVLIPRFETEFLCLKTKEYIKKYLKGKPKIIDLGCGSGAIAIYLSKELETNVTAIDISSKAIKVAKENSLVNKANITIIKGNILKPIKGKYDVIVSNPPYLDYKEWIDPRVKYEPKKALFALDNGYQFYQKILSYSHNLLNKKNIIAFEIGKTQGDYLMALAKDEYPNANIILEKDLNDFDRYLFIINE